MEGRRRVSEMGEDDQKIQTSNCKINNPGGVMYSMMPTASNTI